MARRDEQNMSHSLLGREYKKLFFRICFEQMTGPPKKLLGKPSEDSDEDDEER